MRDSGKITSVIINLVEMVAISVILFHILDSDFLEKIKYIEEIQIDQSQEVTIPNELLDTTVHHVEYIGWTPYLKFECPESEFGGFKIYGDYARIVRGDSVIYTFGDQRLIFYPQVTLK